MKKLLLLVITIIMIFSLATIVYAVDDTEPYSCFKKVDSSSIYVQQRLDYTNPY